MVREASGDDDRERRGPARRRTAGDEPAHGPRRTAGDEPAHARRWTADDEREAARWAGRDDQSDAPHGDDGRGRDGKPPYDRRDAVLERIRETPPGFVRTYGDVSPGAPRFAGTVLHGNHDPDLPWFRIVRADGSLTQGVRQRKLLEAEGVPFRGEKVDMRAARVP